MKVQSYIGAAKLGILLAFLTILAPFVVALVIFLIRYIL